MDSEDTKAVVVKIDLGQNELFYSSGSISGSLVISPVDEPVRALRLFIRLSGTEEEVEKKKTKRICEIDHEVDVPAGEMSAQTAIPFTLKLRPDLPTSVTGRGVKIRYRLTGGGSFDAGGKTVRVPVRIAGFPDDRKSLGASETLSISAFCCCGTAGTVQMEISGASDAVKPGETVEFKVKTRNNCAEILKNFRFQIVQKVLSTSEADNTGSKEVADLLLAPEIPGNSFFEKTISVQIPEALLPTVAGSSIINVETVAKLSGEIRGERKAPTVKTLLKVLPINEHGN